MSKFWMNQTTSSNWHGNQVGISRVEYELFKHLKPAGFIRTHGGFSEYASKAETQNVCDEKLILAKGSPINRANAFVISKRFLPRKIRIARAGGYFLSTFLDISKFSDYVLDRLIFLSYEILRKFRGIAIVFHACKRKKKSWPVTLAPITNLVHPFDDGDLVFTCGLDWDYQIIENLFLVKKQKEIKIVTVVFDLIPVLHPELIQNSRHVSLLLGHFSTLIEISDLILVNSETTQKQLANLSKDFGFSVAKTRIVPWGVTSSDSNLEKEIGKPANLEHGAKFVLAVGTLEIRKNYELLVQVVKLSQETKIRIPLMVFAGRPGWGTHDLMQKIRNDESLRGKLIWLEDVSDKQLNWLYSNCIALLSPTFSEGFGLPVAESQAFKKKLILSDIPIYRELFSSALFASPFDAKQWLELICTLDDATIPVFETYTWEESAKKIALAIKEELRFDVGAN